MKILFTVENYYPRMSGVPVVVKYLAEGLCNLGHNVTIATMSIPNTPKEEEINKVQVKRFDIFYNNFKKPTGNIEEYVNFIKEFDCDIVILQCAQCMTTDLILPYLNELNAKTILHSHGFSGMTLKPFKKANNIKVFLKNTYNFWRWRLYYAIFFKKYISQINMCLCLSEVDSSIKYLKKYHSDVRILSNAADNIFFNKNEEIIINPLCNYTTLKNKRYCLSVANYFEYKNQIGVMKEFYESEVTDIDMVFIGSEKNDYYEKLQKENLIMQEKYPNKKVHILFKVSRDDIPMIIKNATLYLVGSNFEEFSISLIESMAMGVPFISTNVGNAKLLPGGITLHVLEEMKYKIKEVLDDTHLYKQLSLNGKEYASKHCRIDYVVNSLENYLLDLSEGNIEKC